MTNMLDCSFNFTLMNMRIEYHLDITNFFRTDFFQYSELLRDILQHNEANLKVRAREGEYLYRILKNKYSV